MPIQWRKIVLVLAGALICSYALGILWYVHSMPDIGLRTAFTPEIRRVEGNAIFQEDGDAELPQVGDQIVRLNGRTVSTWPHLLQAVRDLRHDSPVVVDTLPRSGSPQHPFLLPDGTQWVRVRFQRPGGEQAECWCRVGPPSEELLASILWFFLKLGLFVVGALVCWKRPTDRSATQFYVLCIVTLGAYMGGYHWSRIASQPILILVFMVCSVALPAVLLHFYSIFPRPKPFLQRSRGRAVAAIYGLPLLFLMVMVATYGRALWLARGDAPEDTVNSVLMILLGEIYVYLGVAALWYLASVVCLVHSFRTASDDTERNQVKWILLGSLGALVPIGTTLYLATVERNAFAGGAATWPMFAASVCFTAAFAISITRYRLMQLDQLISSGMVYFAISFVAGLGYYAVVFVGMFVAGRHSGSLLSQALSVSTSTLVLLFILDLARSRLKKALDRRFYREKHQLERTLRRMGRAIDQLVDPPTLARQLLQASAEVLGAQRGAVYLREGNPPLYRLVDTLGESPPLSELSSGCPLIEALAVQGVVVVASGRGSMADPVQRQLHFLGGEVAHALAHEGQLLALLVLSSRSLGNYGPEDLNVLAAFSQLTGLALKSAERHRTIDALNRELQTKVQKISEQQRRILALQSQLTHQAVPTDGVLNGTTAPAASPGGIIGSSSVVQRLLQLVHKVSASQSAVLLRGESGTGKELLARALHEKSPRAGKAFVKVHCAALSTGLLESELFGHVKGAFTGAHRDKVGRFEFADGGTLFLDEIGDISLEVQTKLLRVLQEMTFERVGSSEPVQVDVRLIAATHQNLEALMAQGRFREDLYYRLNVISVCVPPLRERREDIPELALHFLRLHGQRSGKNVTQMDDDALAVLKAYAWPGNIRQLENVIERAVVVAEGTGITIADLPAELAEAHEPELVPAGLNGKAKVPFEEIGIHGERAERDRRERERLVRALAAADGNKARAARALGLARSTLVSRLKKLGLS
ncbi:MAG TPA: sigma 54-interacting transcriptional regulator [Gemmataceae bacterium]|nr:sigma 54-interacting transcriptional regulator [Gemmataceae bacterium]